MRSCWRCWAAAFWRGGTKAAPRGLGLCVLCAVATLVRPYEAVLWLFPLALCRQDRRRIAVCVAGGAVSLGGTLVLMSKFYAPYFFTNVDLSPLQELARGQVVSAVRDVAHKLLDALRTVAEMLADQLANRSGGQYLLFFPAAGRDAGLPDRGCPRRAARVLEGLRRRDCGHRLSGAAADVPPR